MSTQYKKSSDVPTSVLCERLSQLSDAITKGRPNDHEFTMRIPAECDRDADLVMSEAAKRLLHAEAELSILPGKWSEDSSLETWFPYTNDELVSLRDENLKLKSELEAIKKQEAYGWLNSYGDFTRDAKKVEEWPTYGWIPLYVNPVKIHDQEPVQWVCELSSNPWPNGGGTRRETKEEALAYINSEYNHCKYNTVSPIYKKPVYQHSFTVDGHTFYADNEVDILYLERKFGVGGKAKLNLVEDK